MTLYYIALMIFGIGLLIFVHELGHYLVAKWADVKVEAFSLGFGPAIVQKTVGETTYMICAIPLGGYVKMAGEPGGEDGTGDARDFSSKSVGARTAIILAGPMMNIVFALIAFPIIFSIGINMDAPVVGVADPGGPAWVAGLERGDRITALNGNRVYSFEDIRFEVALADGPIRVDFVRDGEPRSAQVDPEYVDKYGFQVIKIGPDVEPGFEVQAKDDAEIAGLDRAYPLVSFAGVPADRPVQLREKQLELQRRLTEVPLVIDKNGKHTTITVAPRKETLDSRFLGIRFIGTTTVEAVKRDAKIGLATGDRVLKVNGRFVFNAPEFREAVLDAPPGPVRLEVKRLRDAGSSPVEVEVPALADVDARESVLEEGPFTTANIVSPVPGCAAERAGFRAGDQIVEIDGDETKTTAAIQAKIRAFDEEQQPKGLAFAIRRPRPETGAFDELTIHAAPARDVVNGALAALRFKNERRVDLVKFPFPDSVGKGIRHSGIWTYKIFNTLRSLFTGGVSPKTLGGIMTIGYVTYDRAKQGWMRLFYFLAILSVNLAVVNLIPIPTLDGGHLVFLAIEKIKGSPVSERVQGIGLRIGVIIIFALIIFVTFNDIQRLFG